MKTIHKNNHGFAHIGLILLAVLVITAIGGAGYYVATRNKTENTISTSNATSQQEMRVTGNTLATRCFEVKFPDKVLYNKPDGTPQEFESTMQSSINDCNSISAWEGIGDFPVFKVTQVKSIEPTIDQDEAQLIKAFAPGSVVEKSRIKVGGYDAAKVVGKDSNGLDHVFVTVRGPKDNNASGSLQGFFITGYYYNETFKNTFDPALASLKWKL